MKWYSVYEHPARMNFIIEYDENVGYYIYLYENSTYFERDSRSAEGCPHHQDDYLQDTLEIAKEFSYEEFGVPMDSWVEARPS